MNPDTTKLVQKVNDLLAQQPEMQASLDVKKQDISKFFPSDHPIHEALKQPLNIGTWEWNEKVGEEVLEGEVVTHYQRVLLSMIPISLHVLGPIEERHLRVLASYVATLDTGTNKGVPGGVKKMLAVGSLKLADEVIDNLDFSDCASDRDPPKVKKRRVIPDDVSEHHVLFAYPLVIRDRVFKTLTVNGEPKTFPIHPFAATFREGEMPHLLAE